MILDLFYNAFQGAIAVAVIYFGWKILWTSTLILQERKENFRAGTHDYYGNRIEDED
jgi:hypothetical protein